MCSIGLKSEMEDGLFLRLNTAVRSKLISNSCNTEHLDIFKTKFNTLQKTFISLNFSFDNIIQLSRLTLKSIQQSWFY